MPERLTEIRAAMNASRARYEAARDQFVGALGVPTITPEQQRAGQALAGMTDALIDYVSAMVAQYHLELQSIRSMLDPGEVPFE